MITLLRRAIRRTLTRHLLIPLIVLAAIEIWPGIRDGTITNLASFTAHLRGFFAVYLTFVVILALDIRREADVRVTNVGTLEDILRDSTSYFAVSTTSLRGWFDPAVQVYLAMIASRKIANPRFSYMRVLLFFSEDEFIAAHATYLDEYYAKSFADMHERLSIDLAFLRPQEVMEVLRPLGSRQLKRLGIWRPFSSWMLKFAPAWLPIRWLVRSQPLAFALVERANSRRTVVLFSKNRNVLNIREVTDPERSQLYQELGDRVKAKVLLSTGEVSGDHDFNKSL